jgi:cytochrome c556
LGVTCGAEEERHVSPSQKTHLLSAIACLAIAGVFGGTVLAQSPGAAAITARQLGFKQQGGAFKTILDQLKAPAPDIARIRTAANVINRTAGQITTWFPAGSGPGPGVRTAARPEIWTNSGDFNTAMTAFRNQAPRLKAAADSGDIARIRTEFGATGLTCRNCHVPFRAERP